jgi:Ca2+-binding RTX toxin-like protein
MSVVITDSNFNAAIGTGAPNQTIIMAPGSGRAGASLTQPASLFNYGTFSAFDDTVVISAGSFFHNMEEGVVIGIPAVTIETASPVVIVNDGLILGHSFGINLDASGGSLDLDNSGEIFGGTTSVLLNGQAESTYTIDNSGLISADTHGVFLDSVDSTLTFNNSGTVSHVGVGEGQLLFTNTGVVTRSVFGGNLADTVTNNGTIGTQILLNGGNDVYRGSGKVPSVDGGSGNDSLTGATGVDLFFGGDDNDTLIGGLGMDDMSGEAGNDIFRFTAKTHSSTGSKADIIRDFDDLGFTGDRIDVSLLFGPRMEYRHTLAFDGAGQVRVKASGSHVIVEVNTCGSLAADFAVRLLDTTVASMNAGDFIL